jgi:hypothetical protein
MGEAVRAAHTNASAAFLPHGNDRFGERFYTVAGASGKWQRIQESINASTSVDATSLAGDVRRFTEKWSNYPRQGSNL